MQSSTIYDFIIIGCGPTGITLAWYLQKLSPLVKILLVDRENSIGGCHRVRRVHENNNTERCYKIDANARNDTSPDTNVYKTLNSVSCGLFSEHGPRIYMNNYMNFQILLDDMFQTDEPFFSFFTQYKFGGTDLLKYLSKFAFRELFVLAWAFFNLMLNNDYGKQVVLANFMSDNNFSRATQDYINRLCILTDGGQIDRYTLNEALQIINQNALYQIYQPKASNDIFLWKEISRKLISSGQINILLNQNVYKILDDGTKAIGVQTSDNHIYMGNNVLMAVPPIALLPVLKNSSSLIKSSFGDFDQLSRWIHYTAYDTYIPIVFYFDKTELETIWGTPNSDWGVANIVLSDYLVDLKIHGTVISTCLSLLNNRSFFTNKTVNQTDSANELAMETFRQLNKIYDNKLPLPNKVIISPEVSYNKDLQKYETKDGAYFQTVLGHMPVSKTVNFHNIGCQNGKSNYAFTSLESAVENAMYFLQSYYPSTLHISLSRKFWTIKDLLTILLVSVIIILSFIVWPKIHFSIF